MSHLHLRAGASVAKAFLHFARSNPLIQWRLLRREEHPPRNDISLIYAAGVAGVAAAAALAALTASLALRSASSCA